MHFSSSYANIHLVLAQIAQLVEQRTENPCVAGSIPALGIYFLKMFLIVEKDKTKKIFKKIQKLFKKVLTIKITYDIIHHVLRNTRQYKNICGCSSMVEHQPSKLDTWVRFPSPAFIKILHEWLSGGVSPCQGEGRGFESRLVLFLLPISCCIIATTFSFTTPLHIPFLEIYLQFVFLFDVFLHLCYTI